MTSSCPRTGKEQCHRQDAVTVQELQRAVEGQASTRQDTLEGRAVLALLPGKGIQAVRPALLRQGREARQHSPTRAHGQVWNPGWAWSSPLAVHFLSALNSMPEWDE